MVEVLKGAGIRFALFSDCGRTKTAAFAEGLGLETDWNTGLSPKRDRNFNVLFLTFLFSYFSPNSFARRRVCLFYCINLQRITFINNKKPNKQVLD